MQARINFKRLVYSLGLLTAAGSTLAADRVVDTVHNLSVSGPGQYKSETVDQVCVFCHTPHRAALGPGLWNREVRGSGDAASAAPDIALADTLGGTSALCMSCHDGTIALGSMRQPPRKGGASDLRDVYLRGRSSFGTDLSNHHPIGLPYAPGNGRGTHELVRTGSVDLPLHNGELHCTSCHDAHSDEHPPFLRKTSEEGQLCEECHRFSGADWSWSDSVHATSVAVPRSGDPWAERKAEWKGYTVRQNGCQNCHAPHNAGSARALVVDMEERTCFRCHNGSVSELNIQSEVQNFYRHPVEEPAGSAHDPSDIRDTFGANLHVECEDCHNPHATRDGLPMISFDPGNPADNSHGTAPYLTGSMKGVSGVDIDGMAKLEADYEYEVCFKCHGVPGRSACGNRRCSTATDYQMTRTDTAYNLREKFDSNNPALVSYHPIENNNPANDTEVPSLRIDIPLYRFESLIYCGDCHSGDRSPSAGGIGASGPHGSRHPALLALGYELDPGRRFNSATNALCFKCHDVGSLISDESFLHRLHVWEQGNSCVNCHDPHGSARYPHLINFLETASSGGRILEITGVANAPETPFWIDKGRYAGTCWLNCHGVVHEGSGYGEFDTAPDDGSGSTLQY